MEAKKIIITGGATRIGSAIAKSLAGYDVEITIHFNKSIKLAKKLKAELEEIGTKVIKVKVVGEEGKVEVIKEKAEVANHKKVALQVRSTISVSNQR